MSDYLFIDRQHQLDLALTSLASVDCMGIDTESSGYYTYFSELCLIQISAGDQHYIIDTLAGLNLDGLGPLFADPGITKIFHAAASDIAELKRDLKFDFVNVFDTMIACRMLGHDSCSLLSLVKHYKGIDLEKKEQKSNWKKRPLTRSQLDYANLDTVFLEELMRTMSAELAELNLSEEIQEEFEWIASHTGQSGDDAGERDFDPNGWLRIRGAVDLPPKQRAVVKALYEIRDQRARKENLAAFRLVTNDGLLRILRKKPKSVRDLEQLRAINPVMLRKDGERLLEALQTTAEITDDHLPKPAVEDNPELRALVRRLKRWRSRVAEYRGMDPSMIVTNKALFKLADVKPRDLSELEGLQLLTDWKARNYGEHLLGIVHGTYNGELPENLPRLPADVREAREAKTGARS
ncbi:MAG: HRDC domain-containing protein [Leptospirales bacterium]